MTDPASPLTPVHKQPESPKGGPKPTIPVDPQPAPIPATDPVPPSPPTEYPDRPVTQPKPPVKNDAPADH